MQRLQILATDRKVPKIIKKDAALEPDCDGSSESRWWQTLVAPDWRHSLPLLLLTGHLPPWQNYFSSFQERFQEDGILAIWCTLANLIKDHSWRLGAIPHFLCPDSRRFQDNKGKKKQNKFCRILLVLFHGPQSHSVTATIHLNPFLATL